MDALERILEQKGGQIHAAAPEMTVVRAVEEMCRARVGALVVLREDRLVGIFSERDLMTRVLLERRDPEKTRVGDVMSTQLVRVTTRTLPHEAMALMTECRVRHLPVMEGERLVGIVSIGDLVRWSVADRDRLIEDLKRYLEGRYP